VNLLLPKALKGNFSDLTVTENALLVVRKLFTDAPSRKDIILPIRSFESPCKWGLDVDLYDPPLRIQLIR